jgi:hypothetical protein
MKHPPLVSHSGLPDLRTPNPDLSVIELNIGLPS